VVLFRKVHFFSKRFCKSQFFLVLVKIKAVVEPVETLRVKSCRVGGGVFF